MAQSLEEIVRKIRTELLQTRLIGKLTSPEKVMEIVCKHQPPSGLDNLGWTAVCDFILEIEPADNNSVAKIIAEKYNLSL